MTAMMLQDSQWITSQLIPGLEDHRRPTILLKKDFVVVDATVKAQLQITALGVVEAYLNGHRIGADELVPGFTEYNLRLQVFVYDVTSLVVEGVNVLSFELSDGWYCGSVGVLRARDQWGNTPAVCAELSINSIRSTQVVSTDGSWSSRLSSHNADMMHGETFDFRADKPGQASLQKTHPWGSVHSIDGPRDFVVVESEPVRITETLAPTAITETPHGWIVDFGENIVGGISLDALGPVGNKLRFVYGEALDSTGDVTQKNFTPVMPFIQYPLLPGQVDEVISNGDDTQFIPRHSTKGFRFVRVEGTLSRDSIERIRATVFRSDFAQVGAFNSSNQDLNWLEKATRRSLVGNAIDIPTDCPTRERAGWSADWDIFLPTAAYMFDVRAFTLKWLRDLAAGQWSSGVVGNMAPMPPVEGEAGKMAAMNGSAGWADSIVSIPWSLYEIYGQAEDLREFWPNMENWLGHVTTQATTKRHASRVEKYPTERPHEQYLWDTGFHFGEWFEPDSNEVDLGSLFTADAGPIATAFYRRTTRQMSEIARLLGEVSRAKELAELSEHIKQAWREEFLDSLGRVIPASQANCVRALAFDLVSEEERPVIAAQLVEIVRAAGNHLGTGFLATPYLLPALADAGYPEVAFEILMQRDYPSWLLMKDQGATTVWERWEGYDESGNPVESHNHYSKGAVTRFIYEYVAGLRRVSANVEQILFKPLPGFGVTSAEANYLMPRGNVSISWVLEGNSLTVHTSVPEGVTAHFVSPSGEERPISSGESTFILDIALTN